MLYNSILPILIKYVLVKKCCVLSLKTLQLCLNPLYNVSHERGF